MEQKLLNAKMLRYFEQRLKDDLCDIAFIESELKRAEVEEDYERAIAIREALHEIRSKELS